MHCPDCDFELPQGQSECPRCSFRRAIHAAASDDETAMDASALPPRQPALESDPLSAEPIVPPPALSSRRVGAMVTAALFAVLMLCGYAWHQAHPPLTPTQKKIAMIFASADGPCRNGDKNTCMSSIKAIRALNDYPDGSLLLGDYMIAKYLPTQQNGMELAVRWRHDQITEPELMAMGETAYAQNLVVCRSFWMYGQIKRDHMPIPQFIIGGVKMPQQTESQ